MYVSHIAVSGYGTGPFRTGFFVNCFLLPPLFVKINFTH